MPRPISGQGEGLTELTDSKILPAHAYHNEEMVIVLSTFGFSSF
jgi:hypothetical protein